VSDFNQNEVESLNSELSEALGNASEEDVFVAASKVANFWSSYLYADAALYNARFELLKELEELDTKPLFRALAVNRIVNSDFWDGNLENLNKISTSHKPQILKAAQYILETSKTDTEFFGETS